MQYRRASCSVQTFGPQFPHVTIAELPPSGRTLLERRGILDLKFFRRTTVPRFQVDTKNYLSVATAGDGKFLVGVNAGRLRPTR
jgi:hypothetical protein